jgi:hypothetical protein
MTFKDDAIRETYQQAYRHAKTLAHVNVVIQAFMHKIDNHVYIKTTNSISMFARNTVPIVIFSTIRGRVRQRVCFENPEQYVLLQSREMVQISQWMTRKIQQTTPSALHQWTSLRENDHLFSMRLLSHTDEV